MALVARHLNDIIKDLETFLEAYNGRQQALANCANISQSTISRFLKSSNKKRLSKGVKKLCKYAGIDLTESVNALNHDPCTNNDLISALRDVWDGTPAHAKAIAKIIRDLKNLH